MYKKGDIVTANTQEGDKHYVLVDLPRRRGNRYECPALGLDFAFIDEEEIDYQEKEVMLDSGDIIYRVGKYDLNSPFLTCRPKKWDKHELKIALSEELEEDDIVMIAYYPNVNSDISDIVKESRVFKAFLSRNPKYKLLLQKGDKKSCFSVAGLYIPWTQKTIDDCLKSLNEGDIDIEDVVRNIKRDMKSCNKLPTHMVPQNHPSY